MNKSYIKKLVQIVGKNNVLTSVVDRESYAYDSSPYYHLPDIVVFPVSTEQVRRVMEFAYREKIPVVPRGAGTCLSGGAVPSMGGISLVLTKMNKILEVDIPNERIVVQTGVTNIEVQKAVKKYGYMFAPDPASLRVATIGGNIAENAGGMRSVKYGLTKDHVLGLEVVLPNGIISRTGQMVGCPGNLDLTPLFCASEGTLGVVTQAILKLTKIPPAIRTLLVTFRSVEDAGSAVSDIIASGIVPTAMEIMDDVTVMAIDEYLNYGFPKDSTVLLIEIDGLEEELDNTVSAIASILRNNNSLSIAIAKDDVERSRLWHGRQSMNGALGRIKPGQVIQDPTVPINKMSIAFARIKEIAQELDMVIPQQAHAGDGNLHPSLMYDPDDEIEYKKVEKATEEIFKAVISMGGTLSGEHGIGLEKKYYMPLQFLQSEINFMSAVKKAFDPHGVMNPDKIF